MGAGPIDVAKQWVGVPNAINNATGQPAFAIALGAGMNPSSAGSVAQALGGAGVPFYLAAGFELGFTSRNLATSALSPSVLAGNFLAINSMLDINNPYGLLSLTGIGLFFGAAQTYLYFQGIGQPTLALNTTYNSYHAQVLAAYAASSLTSAQVEPVYQWLNWWCNQAPIIGGAQVTGTSGLTAAEDFIVQEKRATVDSGVHVYSDLLFLQWGQVAMLPYNWSLVNVEPGLGPAPELGWFLLNAASPCFNNSYGANAATCQYLSAANQRTGLSVDQTRKLVNDPNYGFRNGTAVEAFLTQAGTYPYVPAPAQAVIAGWFSSVYNLTVPQWEQVALFLNWYLRDFIALPTVYGFLAGDLNTTSMTYGPYGPAWPIVGRTARQWAFEAQDYLLLNLEQDPHAGTYYDDREAPNRAAALVQGKKNRTLYRGGDASDVDKYVHDITYYGSKTVYVWKQPVPVQGTIGDFEPYVNGDQDQMVWTEDLARPIMVSRIGDYYEKGIKLYYYQANDEFWGSATDYPSRDLYWQSWTGWLNITAIKSFEVLITRSNWAPNTAPHPRGLGGSGLDGSPEWYSSWTLGVEPESGLGMFERGAPQVNFALKYNLTWFADQQVPVNIYPIIWTDQHNTISASQASTFQASVNLAKNASLGFYVGFTLFGALLILIGLLNWMLWKRRGDQSSLQRKLADMELKT